MRTREYECYGGPIDGQTMPLLLDMPDGDAGLHAFMVHVSGDGVPHFYTLTTRVNTETLETYEALEYGGTNPSTALSSLREREPELVDKIERDLNAMLNGHFDTEDFDDCETD